MAIPDFYSMRNKSNSLRVEVMESSSQQHSIFSAPNILIFEEDLVEDEEIVYYWSHRPASVEKNGVEEELAPKKKKESRGKRKDELRWL
ncbi:hypothetical protein HAX54_051114, partial [Datura stramonium]|nr:hypothetical protein [Datura stramonium]